MVLRIDRTERLFRFLDHLGELDDGDLLERFTGDNIDAVRQLAALLKEELQIETIISEKRFIRLVRELTETRRIWHDRLLGTLENASREMDKGNRIQALWIINGFIRFCPSPYYRELAEEAMEEYERQESGDRSHEPA